MAHITINGTTWTELTPTSPQHLRVQNLSRERGAVVLISYGTNSPTDKNDGFEIWGGTFDERKDLVDLGSWRAWAICLDASSAKLNVEQAV